VVQLARYYTTPLVFSHRTSQLAAGDPRHQLTRPAIIEEPWSTRWRDACRAGRRREEKGPVRSGRLDARPRGYYRGHAEQSKSLGRGRRSSAGAVHRTGPPRHRCLGSTGDAPGPATAGDLRTRRVEPAMAAGHTIPRSRLPWCYSMIFDGYVFTIHAPEKGHARDEPEPYGLYGSRRRFWRRID
jgi:hypothetical protein